MTVSFKTASFKANIVANFLGQGWRALLAIAFVPLYIHYLGIEAYGLIGIFAIMQAWLALLDMGMRPALGREMARFTGGVHSAQSVRDLLRSIEVVGLATAAGVAVGIWAASGWLAAHWVTGKTIRVDVIAQSFALMGAVAGLSFVENIYVSSIAGLQRQVLQNAIISVIATIRALGAIAILAWISPTLQSFFVWQGVVSLMTVALLASVVYRVLPATERSARFSWPALAGIWRFAAGMAALTLLELLLIQVDKILLSRLLSLDKFGYYVLAGTVANTLLLLSGPIVNAFFPRMTELVARGDVVSLRAAYHQGAQMVTVIMGTAAITLMAFGYKILLAWTADPTLAGEVAPIMTVLALGTMLHTLTWIPYQLQLAHGWTQLEIKVSGVAVALVVPTILWVVPLYGPLGAAWIWVAINTGYVLVTVQLMHRRLLPAEKWRWYAEDVTGPVLSGACVALICRWTMPDDLGRLGELSFLSASFGAVLFATALTAPLVRRPLLNQLRCWLRGSAERYRGSRL